MKNYCVQFFNENGYMVHQEYFFGTYSWVWNESILMGYFDFNIFKE